MDGDFSLARHVEWVSARTHAETQRLTSGLVGRSWPGGHDDRSERGALDWVKRWRAHGPRLELLACECATGHCSVCN
jgi:hypothetical protein